ncbi:hypothetical protein IMG5_096980 [Ichthyophthirius multifiliis]|uniref:Kelch motif family protein n=1 Tax=Ichthyophthirius multifiliis TaxID=5932 RepID=G0QRR8_ICHMU|nr:hypothetical protein IMG5_096980 [Ichthyophthirius multifiliis]EGR32084.1 hypothetical protein IMG5_096980 [Ichthyophthirius multifiliis]|eukprot:XP_004035570.1 hypothetical protein IMG5_096980 [Ichthyophthirius multifiliis]
MLYKRCLHASVLIENKLYIIGGKGSGNQILSSCEIYDIESGKKEELNSLNEARCNFQAIVLQDFIYVFGGVNEKGETLGNVERY